MNKAILCLVAIFLVVTAAIAEAQQPKKVPRIGYLSLTTSPRGPDAFLQGLRDLGYIEGQNIVIEYRDAAGRAERLSDLAAELVRLKVDVIVAGASQSARAAKQATKTIAVVFHGVGDPVAQGIVDSLARPGGNITGVASLSPEVGGKRLELLKEVVPTASRVVVFVESYEFQQLAPTERNPDGSPDARFQGAVVGGIEAGRHRPRGKFEGQVLNLDVSVSCVHVEFTATLLLHSKAFKKPLFLQLVDQTFIEKLFYPSVCYRAT